MTTPTQSTHTPKMQGGAGAAEHMLNAAGNMNQQQAGADGSLAYKMPVVPGGVGLTEALVPAVLVLANTKLSKNWLRNSGLSGKTLKNGLSIRGGSNEKIDEMMGGNLANAIVIPTSLARVKNYMGSQLNKTVKQTMNARFMQKSRSSHSSKRNGKSKRRFRGKR